MAVRRQLRLLFQEPQLGNAIMVERTGPGTKNCHHKQQTAKTLENPGERLPGARGLRLEDCMLYQCRSCRAVLGDSLHLCAQEEKLRLLVCFKVTNDVVVEDKLMVCIEGDLIGCTYNLLYCRSCEAGIGFRLYCSKPLAYLRGFFCLLKEGIVCYLLKTKTTVEASKMTCPPVSLKEHVQKLKESLVLVHMRIEQMIKKLEEINQKKIVAEKQGYKARLHGQASGSSRRKLNN
ncbi:protein Mis18-beta [Rhineura floridana]|uniref:protein Mis18-beta n=1 Tax=Rhineura floridana TaxID=261503 RepID=UPI002AC7E931|nr:protein Mis18-beta [Rhineura floridana]